MSARSEAGPAAMFDAERKVAPSQWRAIARLACLCLRVKIPQNRLEASTMIVRLQHHLDSRKD